MFKNDKKIKDDLYTVDELNFVLDTLFYFKTQGNIIAHINISVNDSIKLRKINIEIKNIKSYIENLNNKANGKNINLKLNDTQEKSNIIINKNEINNSEIKFNNVNEKVNCDDCDEKIPEKIRENINLQKEDWLEIKNYIFQGVNDLIKEIKDKIIWDFYESSINDKVNIKDIVNFIFKKDYNNLFITNSAFTRTLSQTIDDLIQKKELNTDFSKFDEIKTNISKFLESIELMENSIDEFKDFKIELNNYIYRHINTYIKHYIKTKYYKDGKISGNYIKIIKNLFNKIITPIYMKKIESQALIMSLIIPIIKSQELNNLNSFILNFRESLKKYYILDNTKSLLNDFEKILEDFVKKSNDYENKDLFSEIKCHIQKCKTSSNAKDMSYEKLIKIITELFDKKKFDWTKIQNSEISLESLLFYYQNKSNKNN